MKVCSRWEKIINDLCLFHTILITNQNTFHQVKKKLKQTPSYCLQVERLVIFIQTADGDFLSTLPILLPNLRFYFRLPKNANSSERITDDQNYKWSNRLEKFYDTFAPNLYRHVLGSNKYNCLKTLSIRNCSPPYDAWLENSLKNAPNLTSLILTFSSLKVNHLEQIHTHLPLLESIRLVYCIVDFTNSPMEIKPALRVTHAHFDLENLDDNSMLGLQEYIRRKYVNLIHLSIEIFAVFYDFFLDGDMGAMDIRMNEVQEMLTSLLHRFGSQLKELNIDFRNFDPHLLENLGGAAYRLECLTLSSDPLDHAKMETLLNLSPFHHLRSLHLDSFVNESLICLQQLINLKKLTIDDRKLNIKLNDILDNCSNGLEYLCLKRCSLSLHLTSTIYSLKTINFNDMSLPKNIDTFISNSCHQLKCLQLMNCKYEIPTFCLEDLHLVRLEVVDFKEDFSNSYILVFTKSDDQRRWWRLGPTFHMYSNDNAFDPYDDPVYPLSLPLAFESLTCQPYITFNIGSVRHIYTCSISDLV
ncbi:hypothetical protein K501DRAFT_303745 [Backusella circina FSU 941]|nr:hypothetical protein K501DRAFT_303745 [Backusella circina FSU 941]